MLKCVLVVDVQLIRQVALVICRGVRELNVNAGLRALRVAPFVACHARDTFYAVFRSLRQFDGQDLVIGMGDGRCMIVVSSTTGLQVNPRNGLRFAAIRAAVSYGVRRCQLIVLANVFRAWVVVVRLNVCLVNVGVGVLNFREQYGDAGHFRKYSPWTQGRVGDGDW